MKDVCYVFALWFFSFYWLNKKVEFYEFGLHDIYIFFLSLTLCCSSVISSIFKGEQVGLIVS